MLPVSSDGLSDTVVVLGDYQKLKALGTNTPFAQGGACSTNSPGQTHQKQTDEHPLSSTGAHGKVNSV